MTFTGTRRDSETGQIILETRVTSEALQQSTYLEVNEEALHGSVRVVDHQVKVKLLDEQQLILQNLLQNPLLPRWALLQKVAHKLGAGHVKLIHFTGQVCTCQPEKKRLDRPLCIPTVYDKRPALTLSEHQFAIASHFL